MVLDMCLLELLEWFSGMVGQDWSQETVNLIYNTTNHTSSTGNNLITAATWHASVPGVVVLIPSFISSLLFTPHPHPKRLLNLGGPIK